VSVLYYHHQQPAKTTEVLNQDTVSGIISVTDQVKLPKPNAFKFCTCTCLQILHLQPSDAAIYEVHMRSITNEELKTFWLSYKEHAARPLHWQHSSSI